MIGENAEEKGKGVRENGEQFQMWHLESRFCDQSLWVWVQNARWEI